MALSNPKVFIWQADYEKPDFITINRFRNRVKNEINEIFTQLALILVENGYVGLEVEYTDGTKIESKASKYTFVWRKTVEKNREKLLKQLPILLEQVDDVIAQDNAASDEHVEITPARLTEIAEKLKEALKEEPQPTIKKARRCNVRNARRDKGDREETRLTNVLLLIPTLSCRCLGLRATFISYLSPSKDSTNHHCDLSNSRRPSQLHRLRCRRTLCTACGLRSHKRISTSPFARYNRCLVR